MTENYSVTSTRPSSEALIPVYIDTDSQDSLAASQNAESANGYNSESEESCLPSILGEESTDGLWTNPLPTILEENDPAHIVDIKICESSTCSRLCRHKCDEKVRKFSEMEIEIIKESFKGSKLSTKNELLKHIQFQRKAGLPTNVFFFFDHQFCIGSFSALTNISTYILKSVIKDFHRNVRRFIHGNKFFSKESLKVTRCVSWILVFVENFAQAGWTGHNSCFYQG